MIHDRLDFNRGAVRPFACLREGWLLVKENYWLFLGITLLGDFLAGLGPMFILVGPAMCGIHLCLLRQERGLNVTFEMLFTGFNYFLQGFIATIFVALPQLFLFLIAYIGSIVCVIFIGMEMDQVRGRPPDMTTVYLLGGTIGVLVLGAIGCILLINMLFLFAFPLIVDRELSGLEAIKLSFRAAMGNIVGMVGLVIVIFAVDLVGFSFCGFGAILVKPIHYALVTIAYRQVFPALASIPPLQAEDPDDDLDRPFSHSSSEATGISAAPRDLQA